MRILDLLRAAMRLVAFLLPFPVLCGSALADPTGTWYFRGIGGVRLVNGVAVHSEIVGQVQIREMQSEDHYTRFRAQGTIGGVAFDLACGGTDHGDSRAGFTGRGGFNFLKNQQTLELRQLGAGPLLADVMRCDFLSEAERFDGRGVLTRTPIPSGPVGDWAGRYGVILNSNGFFVTGVWSPVQPFRPEWMELGKVPLVPGRYDYQAPDSGVIHYANPGVRNRIAFVEDGSSLLATEVLESDGKAVDFSGNPIATGTFTRLYRLDPSRLVALTTHWEQGFGAFWEVNGGISGTTDLSILRKSDKLTTLEVPVLNVSRLGTIPNQPIEAQVYFFDTSGSWVAGGKAHLSGRIVIEGEGIDPERSYHVELRGLGETCVRCYAGLVPSRIQAGQLALPVSLESAVREQLRRLESLPAGTRYNLSGVSGLLYDWGRESPSQPIPIDEMRKREQSLARLYIALQQLADLHEKTGELANTMGKAVMNTALAWQEGIETCAKLRKLAWLTRNTQSGARLARVLLNKAIDHFEQDIRDWLSEEVRDALPKRQAKLFDMLLDTAIAYRKTYFASRDIGNRGAEAREKARLQLIQGVGSDVIGRGVLDAYRNATQAALDAAVADTRAHAWSGTAVEGTTRSVMLAAVLLEDLEQALAGVDFVGDTAEGWNSIADALGEVGIGPLFIKFTVGIRAVTSLALTGSTVKLFRTFDRLVSGPVAEVTAAAYRDNGAVLAPLALADGSARDSRDRSMTARDGGRVRVFTAYADALGSLEQALAGDEAALVAEVGDFLADEDLLDGSLRAEIERLGAMAATAAEPRAVLAEAIGSLSVAASRLRDARMDLALVLTGAVDPGLAWADHSEVAIAGKIGELRSSLVGLEDQLANARAAAEGLSAPAFASVVRAWVVGQGDAGVFRPGNVEIRAIVKNCGDLPLQSGWVSLASLESDPGLHSIQEPGRGLPRLQPGESVEVGWPAGLGNGASGGRGQVAGYVIHAGSGQDRHAELSGNLVVGASPGAQDFTIDGTDDGLEGYLNRVVQSQATRWGTGNALTNLRSAQHGTKLNLLIGGCATSNSVILFIDSRPGGVQRITPGLVAGADAELFNRLALDGQRGLTFEPGFQADHAIRVSGTPSAEVHFADLGPSANVVGIGPSAGGGTRGGFVSAIATTWWPAAEDSARYGRTTSGIEVSLDLEALGVGPGKGQVKLLAVLLNNNSDWGSNQTLPPRGENADLGSAIRDLDFGSEPGIQSLGVDVVLPTGPVDSDEDGLADAAETGTGRFVDPSNTGTDPMDPDSDHDGYPDGDEVGGTALGLPSDPNLPDHAAIGVAGSFNRPNPWNPAPQGNVPGTDMRREPMPGRVGSYRWVLDYKFDFNGFIEYKYAAGGWATNWGAGTDPGDAMLGDRPNFRARIEATGIHRFHLDQAAGTQSFERLRFADAAAFLSAYGLPAVGDADRDGVPNGSEFAANTDPTRADSDGDGTDDATDPVPLRATRDVLFTVDLWVQQSKGRFQGRDGTVRVRFTDGALKGSPDLVLQPTGEPGIHQGTLPQVPGLPGEVLGSYHLVHVDGEGGIIEESIAGGRSLVAAEANTVQRIERAHFDHEAPPDGAGTSFFGEDSFDDDTLGPIGASQRWRFNTGAPVAVLANRDQRLVFTSSGAGMASAAWASPSTSGESFDKAWSAAVSVTNTVLPSAGYAMNGMETYVAANFPSGPAVSAYYGLYLAADATLGKGIVSEWGRLDPATLQWQRFTRAVPANGIDTVRFQFGWAPTTGTLTASYSVDGVRFTRLQTFHLSGAEAPPGPPLSRGMGLKLGGLSSHAGALVADGRMHLDAIRVVPGPSAPGYSIWAATHAAGGGVDGDFDQDGVANGLEYFMGEAGATPSRNPMPVAGELRWPRDPEAKDLRFRVEASENLRDWADVTAGVDASDPALLRCPLVDASRRRFVRLVVVSP